jgi:hypothetical protein
MAPEPISSMYFNHSMCLYMYPLTVARQRLGMNFTPTTYTHATKGVPNVRITMAFVRNSK